MAAIGLLALAPTQALAGEPESPGPESNNRGLRDGLVTTTLDQLITDPRLISTDVLRGLAADPVLVGASGAELERVAGELESARLRASRAGEEIGVRTATVDNARKNVEWAQMAVESARIRTATAQSNLSRFGVEAFIGGTDQPDLAGVLATPDDPTSTVATRSLRTTLLVASAGDRLAERLSARARQENERRVELTGVQQRLVRERGLLDAAKEEYDSQTELVTRLTPQHTRAQRRFEEELALRPLPSTTDLTVIAIDAYHNASSIAGQRWPDCRITWHQLAGIGRVESFHGQFGASSLDRGANASPVILGPQLNGERWLAIEDTDEGRLDADLEWDRAVGPMQFIPSSWAVYGADGNGDGRKDPNNLYDAALAAADHLCGIELDQTSRFQRALLGYNRSARYGSDVMAFSRNYAELADIAPPWETSGF